MHLKLIIFIVLSVLNLHKVFGQYDDISATTRSYDLQVPGSDPIRIIEAEPLWNRDPQDMMIPITTTERIWTGLEHRALKPKVKVTSFNTKTNDKNDENETEDTTEDSAEELRKFLKEYAQQFRRTTKSPVDEENNDEVESSESLHKIELITKPSEEPTNRLASLYLDEKYKGGSGGEDKSKMWNLINLNRHKHPIEDKNGWVSLEVVPWSVSKVSRWHSNHVKGNSAQQNPWDNKYSNNYNDYSGNSKPIWNQLNKPLVNYRPGNINYQTQPFDYGNSNSNNNKPNPRPAFPIPSANYAQKVYLQQDYTDEIPKPSWNKDPHNLYNIHSHYDGQETDANCEDNDHPGIITDGLPANFPKPHNEYNRRKGSTVDEHPASHPFNGDGEWVLLTTTKGYKAPGPNGRQRSLDIESDPDLDKESISTHKSVRLTVLPPLKSSKINMTTSHGGLLQVESTFETVDEAQKTALKKQTMKKRPGKRRRPIKQTTASVVAVNTNRTPTPSVTTRKKISDASSVLAAVGAGMIPATMAMLVPMMGRRRKRDLIYSRRSPNIVGLELKLPQSF